MKKKLVSVVLAAVMAATLLTGCGGSKNAAATAPASTTETATANVETSAPEVEESTGGEMVSDETFAVLQEDYDAMVDCYNEVVDLYNSDEIAADADIEDLLNEAADIIEQMGEITQDSITEEDAGLLTDAMVDILEGLSALVDGMEEADNAPGEMVSDENFAILQENYGTLIEVYDAVVEAYSSEEIEANAEIEDALNAAAELLEEMGTIEQANLSEADAEELNNLMEAVLNSLVEIADAMG